MEKICGPESALRDAQQVRELAEKNVERAHASYTQFVTQALNVWSAAPSNAFGFRGIQELAIRLAYYAQTQAQSCASQAQELGRLMGDAMQSLKSSLESKSLEFDY